MKKTIVGAATVVGILAVLHRFGPALQERVKRKCLETFEHMPEDFPPKRIMRSLEQIQEQNTQILRQFEEDKRRPGNVTGGV